jgi:RNA polymerase sigma-70 factor (ECF subfamily)
MAQATANLAAGRDGHPKRDRPGDAADAADQFAARFQSSYRLFWLVAVGIVGDRTAAEDIVQDAAVIALGKLDQFKTGTNFNAWISQIVRYSALNETRKRKHRRTQRTDPVEIDRAVVSSGLSNAPPLRLTADGQLPADAGHFDDAMMQALESINPVARACLLLRTVEALDYQSISQLLDIPQGTAMSHVHRARRRLRRLLTAPPTGGPPGRALP